jgi:hypothetical protein
VSSAEPLALAILSAIESVFIFALLDCPLIGLGPALDL